MRLTWLVYSKIPTCALSTPSVSLLCQRTYSLQDESEERELKSSLLVAPLQILNKSSPPFTRNKIFHKHFATLRIPSNEKKFETLQISYISHEKSVMCSHRNRQENVFNVSSSIARSALFHSGSHVLRMKLAKQ